MIAGAPTAPTTPVAPCTTAPPTARTRRSTMIPRPMTAPGMRSTVDGGDGGALELALVARANATPSACRARPSAPNPTFTP